MSTVVVVVIVIVVLAVIGAIAYFAQAQARRRSLQQRFGPEYDRAVEKHDNPKEAEQELLARKKRHDDLDLRPLDPAARERHLAEWRQVQERFVDSPETAVTEADRLLTLVMGERGYPTEGYEQQVKDLSVEHAGTIERYRTAHDISGRAGNGQASTEDLRQAMVHYRTLFNELLETGDHEHAASNGKERAEGAAERAKDKAESKVEAKTDKRVDDRDDRVRTDTADGEPVVEGTEHTVGTEPAEVRESRARTGAESAAADRADATGARTRTGRRTARRGDENQGA